ncbi:MAG: undecaprenyl-diphosphatase [Rhodobiaceae bacterium]|nr:undecaprenyl-diphosphatase [Rhodobiaceae bacterium]
MAFDQLLLLAAIQGITEFIPVSSSGHLVLAHKWGGTPQAEALSSAVLDVALHLGTLAAVIIYFRQDFVRLTVGAWDVLMAKQTAPRQEAQNMVCATVPVLLAAALLFGLGLIDALRRAEIVAWASILFAVPLYLADRYGASGKAVSDMAARPALMMGLAQMLALIPAGVTIMAGRALGFSREAAARYSMLMAMPVILAFALFSLLDLWAAGNVAALGTALLGAMLAALFAFASIDIFLKLTRRLSLLPFVLYRIGLGAVILLVM